MLILQRWKWTLPLCWRESSREMSSGFGEHVIVSFDEYTNSLLSMKPGDSVELTIMRQSQQEYKEMKFDITLTVLK